MKCPFCQHEESRVTDSRTVLDSIRRRRECLICLKRFTTFETVDLTMQVKKRNGVYEDYSQEKLVRGLSAACYHTKISYEQVRSLAHTITTELMQVQIKEVSTVEIGEIAMKHLQQLDTIAYIRFACVYRRFQRVDELMDALEKIPIESKSQN